MTAACPLFSMSTRRWQTSVKGKLLLVKLFSLVISRNLEPARMKNFHRFEPHSGRKCKVDHISYRFSGMPFEYFEFASNPHLECCLNVVGTQSEYLEYQTVAWVAAQLVARRRTNNRKVVGSIPANAVCITIDR